MELAGKAAYLAGVIGAPESAEVLLTAAHHFDAAVRVAAAAALSLVIPKVAAPVLRELVRDEDAGVRRVAVQAVLDRSAPEFLQTLREVVKRDRDEHIRTLAGDAVKRIELERELER